ncbi:MAG: paraquat-inducible protein A [Magnetococcales bacterium]|nr:paraquat-inducible protein A [Magnetococcales bacterium]
MRPGYDRAKDIGLARCERCGLALSLSVHEQHDAACPRCGQSVHFRKPNSIARTWAWLIAATICYIPANLFPIMTVEKLGQGEPSTIVSGVQMLWAAGMYPIAILVFVASIMVPVLKLIVLTFLLISIQRRSQWRPKDRAILYRITEFFGRWSMIDIYMISILTALVSFGTVAQVTPGLGATFFAGVVVMTMIAAECFDARLIWDCLEENHE